MKKILLLALLMVGASAQAATKGALIEAINSSTMLKSISKVEVQPSADKCFGCSVVQVDGQSEFEAAYARFKVEQQGPNTFKTTLIESSK